jgi:hypothetical protein
MRRSRTPAASRSATAASMAPPNHALLEPVRRRQFPIVADGGGVSSFIHLNDAAAATVLALEHDEGGIYNIVDDEPAPVREWLPVLANVLGAPKPPRHFPRWLARLFGGQAGVMMGTGSRGPRTRRPIASWAGSCATRVGARASWPPTRPPTPPPRGLEPRAPLGSVSATSEGAMPGALRPADPGGATAPFPAGAPQAAAATERHRHSRGVRAGAAVK